MRFNAEVKVGDDCVSEPLDFEEAYEEEEEEEEAMDEEVEIERIE